MRIGKATVRGFGRLVEHEFTFEDGLNCIFGANESGKTTLMAFLLSMLYGQARTGTRNRQLGPDNSRYQPWTGTVYGGSLSLIFADDTEVVIERDFSEKADKVEITDAVKAVSLVESYGLDRVREPNMLKEKTGIDKSVYRSVFVVRHSSLASLAAAGSGKVIADRLTALADTGQEERSAQRATEQLERLAESIGSERAYTRPYAITLEMLKNARAALENTLTMSERYSEDLARCRSLQSEADRLAAGITKRRALLARSLLDELVGLEDKIAEITSGIEKEPARRASKRLLDLNAEKIRDVELAVSELVSLRRECVQARGEKQLLEPRLKKRQAEYDAAVGTLQVLTDKTREFISSSGERRSTLMAEASQSRERLMTGRSLKSSRSLWQALLACVVITAGAAGTTGGLVLTGTAAALAVAGAAVAGVVLAALIIRRIMGIRRALGEFADVENEMSRADERLAAHDRRLAEICEAFGANDRDEVVEALDELDALHETIRRDRQRLEEIDTLLETRADALKEAATRAAGSAGEAALPATASLSQAVQYMLSPDREPAPPAPAAPDEAFADVETPQQVSEACEPLYERVREIARGREHVLKAEKELSGLERARDALLAGMKREEVEAQACAAGDEGDALLVGEQISAEKQDIETDEKRLADLRGEINMLTARLEEGLKGIQPIPDIEERITLLEGRAGLQELHRSALSDADRIINEAAEAFHRQIFPRIETSLRQLLARVTLGAHDSVRLWTDEAGGARSLGLSINDARKDAPIRPESLSQGAVEQVYLCLRLALAEAFSKEEPMPVMLDDPFINYDPARLAAAVDVLREIACDRQVFLFTCQDDVRDLADSAGAAVKEL